MNQPNAGQPGLPPPQPPLQHLRSAGLMQQHRPRSPHRSQTLHSPSQAPYLSPHSSTQSLPQQHQSPYSVSVTSVPQHQTGETAFFGAHPSPFSANSANGSYAASEPGEGMATQAAISRQQYPPITRYQTPQSNSPASIHSPQTDAHGRPLYSIPPMAHPNYYPQYSMQQQPPYTQHQPSSHQSIPLTSAPGVMMLHQPVQQQMPPHQHPAGHSQQPGMVDAKPSPAALQRAPPVMAPTHATPQTPSGSAIHGLPPSSSGPNPSAAPGPIPATTPLVVRQDNNGVQWIAFEYSRDRVKMEYTIRCDVESVNVDELSQEFKANNCVYPRACCGKDQYKGNRLHYESECNAVGWALAQLNPNLREKRGLIQRAVDSWRNSNQDVKLRSRRVRRMAKIQNRKASGGQPGAVSQLPGPPGPASAGLQPLSAGNDLNHGPGYHHQPLPNGQGDFASPASARYTQHFYPQYAQQPVAGSAPMPTIHDGVDPMHAHPTGPLAIPAARGVKDEDEESSRALFGDVPESKRRKFILVDDHQRGARVRVRVMLDQVKMDDMPDAHLRINAVYPRSYYPRQMRSRPGSPGGRNMWDDEDDEAEGVSGTAPTHGRTTVSVPLMDGREGQLPVPRMTKSRRAKEVALNELGHRMSWGQARTFNGRTLFLQKSLDAYRNKVRSTMTISGQDVVTVAPHFETRPGKRRWLERAKQMKRDDSPD